MSAVDTQHFKMAKDDFDGLKHLNTSGSNLLESKMGSQVVDSAMTLNASELNPLKERTKAFDAIKELSASKASDYSNSVIQCENAVEMVTKASINKKSIPVTKVSVETQASNMQDETALLLQFLAQTKISIPDNKEVQAQILKDAIAAVEQ